MIKLLLISGSPVKGSSTDLLLHEIAATICKKLDPTHEVDLKFIKANELRFVPCQACGKAPTPAYCFYDDDLTRIYPLVAECDCLLFGSPVYFDSVSGQAKMFIDRCNCFRPYDFDNRDAAHNFIKLLKRKRPGGMVVVGGDDTGIEQARRTIAGFEAMLWLRKDSCVINIPGSSLKGRRKISAGNRLTVWWNSITRRISTNSARRSLW